MLERGGLIFRKQARRAGDFNTVVLAIVTVPPVLFGEEEREFDGGKI